MEVLRKRGKFGRLEGWDIIFDCADISDPNVYEINRPNVATLLATRYGAERFEVPVRRFDE